MALWIVGVGLDRSQLTMGAAQLMTSGAQVILRTEQCGAVDYLKEKNVKYISLDDSYEDVENFDELALALAQRVASVQGDAVYCVIDVRDESVTKLLALYPSAAVIPGVPVEGPLIAFAMNPCRTFAASDLDIALIEAGEGALIREIASGTLAGDVKIALMERYPDQSPIYMWMGDQIIRTTLDEMDRQEAYDHRTSVYIPANRELETLERPGFRELERIVEILRGPDGCPWDMEQTHLSLAPYAVEEAWEVADALERSDEDALCEELGDLMLQICLHASIAKQYGEFDMQDITAGICKKMIRRHPHVFRHEKGDILDLWDKAKRAEKGQRCNQDVLRGVTAGLPALLRAQKVLGKMERFGKPYAATETALCEISPETLGKMLLSICEKARQAGINAEMTLKKTVDALIETVDG